MSRVMPPYFMEVCEVQTVGELYSRIYENADFVEQMTRNDLTNLYSYLLSADSETALLLRRSVENSPRSDVEDMVASLRLSRITLKVVDLAFDEDSDNLREDFYPG